MNILNYAYEPETKMNYNKNQRIIINYKKKIYIIRGIRKINKDLNILYNNNE